jgi:hypothetical protein
LIQTRDTSNTGIREIVENNTLELYPNPATNYININMPLNVREMKTQIYSIEGRILRVFKTENGEPIPVHDLKPGLYIMRATDEKNVFIGKFISK